MYCVVVVVLCFVAVVFSCMLLNVCVVRLFRCWCLCVCCAFLGFVCGCSCLLFRVWFCLLLCLLAFVLNVFVCFFFGGGCLYVFVCVALGVCFFYFRVVCVCCFVCCFCVLCFLCYYYI